MAFSEFGDSFEGAATAALLGDFCKPAFDLIEPRGTGWGEVQMVARMSLKPGGYLWCFVGAVVVEHQMHFQIGRYPGIDARKETQKLLVAVLLVAHG